MVQRIVIGFVISFIIRQLEKFQDSIDWDKVKKDATERVKALVPGTWFDDEAAKLLELVIDAAKQVLNSSEELKKILNFLAAKKYYEALSSLKLLILSLWEHATDGREVAAKRAVLMSIV